MIEKARSVLTNIARLSLERRTMGGYFVGLFTHD